MRMRKNESLVVLIAILSILTCTAASLPLKLKSLKSSTKHFSPGRDSKLQGGRQHAESVEGGDGRSIRILLMRHGESRSNLVEHSVMRKLNTTSYNIEGTFRYKRRSEELLFSQLSEKGEQQAIEAGKKLRAEFPNVKYVFVSPLLRTVQTASLALRGFPGEVRFFLLPWLKERIALQADFGYNAYEAIKVYPFLDSSIIKGKPFWFLDYWDEEHDEEGLGQQMRELVAENPSIDALLDFIIMKKKTYVENLLQVNFRKNKAFQEIREFVRTQEARGEQVQDDEILLVSHYSMLTTILVGVDSEGNFVPRPDLKPLQNCEIRTTNLDL